MSELKPLPCPFCGGAPRTVARPDNIDGTQFFYALACYCGGYSACAHKMAVEPTPEQAKRTAIEAWNRRAQPAQVGHVPEVDCGNMAGQVLTVDEISDIAMQSGAYDEQLLAFARAIEQAVLAKRVPQWLPIETAPKDGTNVLCWSAEFGARESRNITYTPGSPGHAEGRTDRWWEWLEPKKCWAFNWSPTHWMPLPPPPGIVGENGGA